MNFLAQLKNSVSALFGSGSSSKQIGVYGPTNAGKCLAPDEEVLLADGTTTTVEEMYKRLRARNPDADDISDEDNETWLECTDSVQVPALADDLSVNPKKVSHVFRQEYSGDLYRVTTRRGREVTVSPSHPFITLSDSGVGETNASVLSEGDRVALLNSFTPIGSAWEPSDRDALLTDGGAIASTTYPKRTKDIAPVEFGPAFARFMALVIAEAQHDESHIAFFNESERLRDEFETYVREFGLDCRTYEYDGKTPCVRVNSRTLVEYLKQFDLYPAASRDKHIPNSILTADTETVAEFLRVLFDCEGSVEDSESGGHMISMSSASRDLLVGVQILLLRFGLVGTLREKDVEDETYYELSIGRSNRHRTFRDEIGFNIPYKSDQLNSLCRHGSSANDYTLPVMPALETERDDLGMTQAEYYQYGDDVARMRRKNSITQDRLEKMETELGDRAPLVSNLANADVTWDIVESIERIDYEGYIYDLTVEDDHTFATADGLVVHNTTLCNRIVRDWKGEDVGPASHVPHETRRVNKKENVEIERDGKTVTINIVDTPGVETKVDKDDFIEHDFEEEDAVRRSREAAQGISEAMYWLREDIDGVLYVLDATQDPLTQVNTMLTGIIDSRDIPVLVLANKIDLEGADVERVRQAYPDYEILSLSAKDGDNMDEVYDKIAEKFA